MIAFYVDNQPGIVELKRLVALLGETVFVDEGTLWINGSAVELPPHLAGQTYMNLWEPDQSPDRPVRFGTRDNPVVLGGDEYFVLGDFSIIAADSRFTGPVRQEAIIGVADLRYWPLARVAFLR